MERLLMNDKYSALEASIHLARYNIALNICKDKNVLDVACGEGYGSYLLSNAGAKSVIGIDIDADTIKGAQKNFINDNLKYLNENACDMKEIESNSIDLLVSFETFEHVDEPEKFLSEVKRVTKKNATIIISCPNDYFYYKDGESNPFHKKKYYFNDFKEICEKCLGKTNLKYYAGIHCEGFVNCKLDEFNKNTYQKDMLKEKQKSNSIVISPTDDITMDSCNYYIAIWNLSDATLNNVVFPTNTNSDVLSLIEQLKDNYNYSQEKVSELEKQIDALNEEINKYKKIISINTMEIDELKLNNIKIHEDKVYFEKMYNYAINSRAYKIARKIARLVKRS